jgi:hypothetical protein
MTTPSLDSSSQSGTPGDQPGGSDGQIQPGSETFTLTKAQWDALQGELQSLKSETQSNKDKAVRATNERLNKLEGDVRPMLERALQHTANGKTAAEALNLVQSENEEYQTKQALAEFAAAWKSGKLPAGFGAGTTTSQGVDMNKVLADFGLDPKDPFVAGSLNGKTFNTEADAELAAARILRARQSNQTNPAQQSAAPGELPTPTNYDALAAEYETLSRNPAANFQRMTEIQAELDKLK